MNQIRGSLPPALLTMRAQAQNRWRALSVRDRLGVSVAGVVLGSWVLWSTLIAPPLKTLAQAPAQIESLDLQLQSMQGLAAEARELRGVSPVPMAQAVEVLTEATARLGDKARLTTQGERATLSINGASGEQLRTWLNETRSGARARPVESQLTRGAMGYAGTVVVALSGAPS